MSYQEGLKQWRQKWPQCCRKAKALFPFRLLNSYSEILSNPEPSAANREVAGPLNSPAEEAACLQDLGLPRNLSPDTWLLGGGWVGPQTAALALTLPPPPPPPQGSR